MDWETWRFFRSVDLRGAEKYFFGVQETIVVRPKNIYEIEGETPTHPVENQIHHFWL